MTRLLLDQGLAPYAARILCERGFDAVHVADIGLDKAEDALILERARQDGRVCITLDHDFHAHLARARQGGPSVLLLRVQGLDARRQADLVGNYWSNVRICCVREQQSQLTATPSASVAYPFVKPTVYRCPPVV